MLNTTPSVEACVNGAVAAGSGGLTTAGSKGTTGTLALLPSVKDCHRCRLSSRFSGRFSGTLILNKICGFGVGWSMPFGLLTAAAADSWSTVRASMSFCPLCWFSRWMFASFVGDVRRLRPTMIITLPPLFTFPVGALLGEACRGSGGGDIQVVSTREIRARFE